MATRLVGTSARDHISDLCNAQGWRERKGRNSCIGKVSRKENKERNCFTQEGGLRADRLGTAKKASLFRVLSGPARGGDRQLGG